MPLGDSITKGSHSTGIVGYRKALYEALAGKYGAGNIDFVGSTSNGAFPQPEHNGYSGYHAVSPSSNSIDDFLSSWLEATPPDLILLHIGTNDIDDVYSSDEIATILDLIDDYSTDVYVILALIINRYPYSQKTTLFNEDVEDMANARIASGDLISIVDMENGAGLVYSTDLDDGVHPNDSGYEKMATAWFNAITALCPESPTVDDPGTQLSAEGETITPLQIVASDPNSQPLTYAQTGLPPSLDIDPLSGLITGMISYDAYNGNPYNVTVHVTDSDDNQDSVEFTWEITNINRMPVVEPPGNQISAEGSLITPLQITAQDPDGNSLAFYENATLPTGLSIDSSSGWITGELGYASAGSYPVVITVVDNDPTDPMIETVNFYWTVTETNRQPQMTDPGSQTDAEMHPVNLQIQATDPDQDDAITFGLGTGSILPAGLLLDPETGKISGVIASGASANSPYSVTVIAQDDGSPQLTDEVTFSWNVVPFNFPPGGPEAVFLPLVIH